MGKPRHRTGQFLQGRGRNTCLARLASQVGLQQDIGRLSQLAPLPINLLGQCKTIDRMDERHLARQVFDLVALQGANKVPFGARSPLLDLFAFLHEFLHVVFAKQGLAAGQRFRYRLGRFSLGNRDQPHTGRITPGTPAGFRHPAPDRSNTFSNRHSRHYSSKNASENG